VLNISTLSQKLRNLFSVSTYARYHQGLKEVFLLIKVIYMEKILESLCSKDKVNAFIEL